MIGVIVTVVTLGVGGYLVWDQIPPLTLIADLLADADPVWLAAALLAEVVAIVAFSVIQRRLVVNLGGDLSRRRSVELTLASGAISSALPAGAALGAGYTYRRLRRAGLRGADAGVTMVASAGMLTGALLLLYLVLTGPTLLDQLAEVIGRDHVGGARGPRRRGRAVPHRRGRGTRAEPGVEPAGWIAQHVRTSRETFRAVPSQAWWISSVSAVVKWIADFAVLAAATFAVGASVDFVALATVYVGIQVIRQIPLTPGGIGIIEAALLAGLVTAGAAAAPAAAAVVIYRVLTFWLILPAGAIAALFDRAPAQTGPGLTACARSQPVDLGGRAAAGQPGIPGPAVEERRIGRRRPRPSSPGPPRCPARRSA